MSTLNELYAELERVEQMTEAEVMTAYNADSKDEIVALILEDIEEAERNGKWGYSGEHLSCCDEYRSDREVEEERMQICLSQGLSRYC